MLLSHPSAKTIRHSPNQVRNLSSAQEELSLESAVQNITSSLESLDFNELFRKFDLDTPVCQFMETFSPIELHSLLSKASASTTGFSYNSAAFRVVKQAKNALDDELRKLDEWFKYIEAAGLHVGTVRASLRWLRDVNRRSLDRLEGVQKDRNGVSQRIRVPLEFRYPPPSPRELHPPTAHIPFYMLAWEQQQQRYREAYMALMGHYRPQQDARLAKVYTQPTRHIGFRPDF